MCSTFYALMTPLCAKHVTSSEKHVIRANAWVRSTNVLGEGGLFNTMSQVVCDVACSPDDKQYVLSHLLNEKA